MISHERIQEELAALRAADNYRRLAPGEGHDFSSNDCLCLSTHPGVRQAVMRALQCADRLREGLKGVADTGASTTQIVPVILGANDRALRVARSLKISGFDIRAIRPPTVEAGTARLRIALNAGHTTALVDRLAAVLVKLVQETRAA
ncbi:MAG: hypothetical protein IID61_08865 [SAR324 cluster bacterium]|nr:hypothetical protein [SAR324 cluster bacterium]